MTSNPRKDPIEKLGSGKQLTGITGMRKLPMALYNLIGAQPLFDGLSPGQLILLAQSAMEINFAPGQLIFENAVPDNRFFLILKGKVELRSAAKNHGTISIQMLGPGETLGWTWLFPQEHMFPPYHILSSARTIERTKALFFCTTWLREQCHEDRALGYQLTNRLAAVVIENLKDIEQRLRIKTGIHARRDDLTKRHVKNTCDCQSVRPHAVHHFKSL